MASEHLKDVAVSLGQSEDDLKKLASEADVVISSGEHGEQIDCETITAVARFKSKREALEKVAREEASARHQRELDLIRATFKTEPKSYLDKGAVLVAALAAAAAAYVAWQQLSDATATFRASNDYKTQTDVFDALDRIAKTLVDFDSKTPSASRDRFDFAVFSFDARIGAILGLRADGGITENAWRTLQCQICPATQKWKSDLKFAGKLDNAEKMCLEGWRKEQCEKLYSSPPRP